MDKAEEDVLKWFGHKERVSEKEVDKKKEKRGYMCRIWRGKGGGGPQTVDGRME